MNNTSPQFRSTAYSILKCGYGWNGVIPCDDRFLEKLIDDCQKANESAQDAATRMAHLILRLGGKEYFRKRIDGRPNRLIAVQ